LEEYLFIFRRGALKNALATVEINAGLLPENQNSKHAQFCAVNYQQFSIRFLCNDTKHITSKAKIVWPLERAKNHAWLGT